jgi:hypothetical protein
VDFYKARCAIQYNSETHKGFVTELRKAEAVRFGLRFLAIAWKMLLGYRKAVKSYRDNWQALASMEPWLERLGLEEGGAKTNV